MAVPTRERLMFGWVAAAVCALLALLIWTLWVMPVNRSIAAASPLVIGQTVAVKLSQDERAGIWGSGRSVLLGTADCSVTAPNGAAVPLESTMDLGWEDTLWWFTARQGFAEFRWFTAPESGSYGIECADALDTYEGEFLVAGSAAGSGTVGLGRGGGVSYRVSSVLAFGAVVCPLVSALLVPIMGVQTLRRRRAPRAQERRRRVWQ